MPFFSILIPSYNRPELIGAAVASVLASDFADFELVISDDKSPRQEEIAECLKPHLSDRRVELHLQPENLREARNREFLFSRARGDWQIVLCDDDKLYPHALSTLARAIAEQPGAEIYAFGYTIIDERDRIAYSRRAPAPLRISTNTARLAQEVLVADAFPFWFCHPATFCSHRNVRTKVRPNPNVGIGDDTLFLIDFLNTGGTLQIVPHVLLYYRKMSSNSVGLQMNQSAGELPNLVSRAKILAHLAGRKDLAPAFATFVASARFRRRILFAPMIWSGAPLPDLLAQLSLGPGLSLEANQFFRRRPRQLYKVWLTFRRVFFFVTTFGIAGVRELATVTSQRRRAPFHA